MFVGTAPGVYDSTVDLPASQTRFVFGAAFRGIRYYFSVAAQAANAEWSAQSEEVSEVAAAATTRDVGQRVEASVGQLLATAAPGPDVPPSGVTVAEGLRAVSAFTVSPDGTGLVVEDGHQVRAFDGGGLRPQPALELDDDTRVEDVTLAPDFERSRHVIVALSRTVRGGGREIALERHRLLEGTLGEGALVAGGIETRSAARVAVAMAADGRMFVAQTGALFSFAANGALDGPPITAGAAAGDGPTAPSVLHWQVDDTLWMAGRNATGAAEVHRVAADGTRAAAAFEVPGAARPTLAPVGGRIAVVTPIAGGLRVTDVATGVPADVPVDLPDGAEAILVTPVPTGWYIVVRERSSSGTPVDRVLFTATAGVPR